MKRVILHGNLASTFGREWQLDVESFSECIKAIESNKPGFYSFIISEAKKGIQYCFKTEYGRVVGKEELKMSSSLDKLHISPVVYGAGAGIDFGSLGMSFGIGFLSSYIGGKIMDKLRPKDISDPERLSTNSYSFNGPQNVISQGSAVPVGYGQLIVGSNVISEGQINYDFDSKKGIISNFSYPSDRFRGDNSFLINSAAAGVNKDSIDWSVTKGFLNFLPKTLNYNVQKKLESKNKFYEGTFGQNTETIKVNQLLSKDEECVVQSLYGNAFSIYNETGVAGFGAAKVGPRFVASDGVTEISYEKSKTTEDKQLGYKKLESTSIYKVLDLICEGPIAGFVDEAGNLDSFDSLLKNRPAVICGNVDQNTEGEFECVSEDDSNYNKLFNLEQIQTNDVSTATGIAIVDSGYGYDVENPVKFFIQAPDGKIDPEVSGTTDFFKTWEDGVFPSFNLDGEINHDIGNPGLGQILPISGIVPFPEKVPAVPSTAIGSIPFMKGSQEYSKIKIGNGDSAKINVNNPGEPYNFKKDPQEWTNSFARSPAYPIINANISTATSRNGQAGLIKETLAKPSINGEKFSFSDLVSKLASIVDNLYVTEAGQNAQSDDFKFKEEIGYASEFLGESINSVQADFNLSDICVWPFNTYRNLSILKIKEINNTNKLTALTDKELSSESGLKIFYNVWASVLGLGSSVDGRAGTISAYKSDLDTSGGERSSNEYALNGPIVFDPSYVEGNPYNIDYFGSTTNSDLPSDSTVCYPGRLITNSNRRIYYQDKSEIDEDGNLTSSPAYLDDKISINQSYANTYAQNITSNKFYTTLDLEISNPLPLLHQIVSCIIKIVNKDLYDYGFSPKASYVQLTESTDSGFTYYPFYFNIANLHAYNARSITKWDGGDDLTDETGGVWKQKSKKVGLKSFGQGSHERLKPQHESFSDNIWQLVPSSESEINYVEFSTRFNMLESIRYRKKQINGTAEKKGFSWSEGIYPKLRIGQNFGDETESYYSVDLDEFKNLLLSDERPAIELMESDTSCFIRSLGFPNTGDWSNGVEPTYGPGFNKEDPIEIKIEKPWIGIHYKTLDRAGIPDEEEGSEIILAAQNIGYNALQLMNFYDNVDDTADSEGNRTITFNDSVQNTYVNYGFIESNPSPISIVIPNGDNDLIEDAFIYSAFHKQIQFTPAHYLRHPEEIPPYYQPASAIATIKSGSLHRVYLQDAGFGYPDADLGLDPVVIVTFPHPNPAWVINSGRMGTHGDFTYNVDLTKTGLTSDNYNNDLILVGNTGDYQQQAEIDTFVLDEQGRVTDIEYNTRGKGYTKYFLEEDGSWDLTLSAYTKPEFDFEIDDVTNSITSLTLKTSASGYTDSDFDGDGLDFRILEPYRSPEDAYAWAKSIYLDDIPVKNTKTNDFNFSSFDFTATRNSNKTSVEIGSDLNDAFPTGFQYSFRTINYQKELFGPREGTNIAGQDSDQIAKDPEKGKVEDKELTENSHYQVGKAEYPITHVIDDELTTYAYVSIDVESLLYLYEGDNQKTMMDLTRLAMAILLYIIMKKMVDGITEELAKPPESESGMGAVGPGGGPVPVVNNQAGYTVGKTITAVLKALLNAGVHAAVLAIGWDLAGEIDLSFKIFRINMGEKIKNSGETRPSFLRVQIKYYNEGARNEATQLLDYDSIHYSTVDFKGVVAGSSYSKDIKIILPPNPNRRKRFIEVSRLSRERDYIRGGEKESRFEEKASLKSVTEIKPVNLNYSNSVVFASKINAEEFSSIPKREYHLRLKKVKIPSNYKGASRTYTSQVWDGSFKNRLEWTNNPAWCFYDLITNSRFGLGRFGIKDKYANKWNLYSIAKYCDELVYTGLPNKYPFRNFEISSTNARTIVFEITDSIGTATFYKEFGSVNEASKGEVSIISNNDSFMSRGVITEVTGNTITILLDSTKFTELESISLGGSYRIVREFDGKIVEPRFSFNAYIKDQQDALKLINDITSLFNSIIYWSQGEIYLSSDQPKDPVMLFNNSNISSNGFNYSSTRKDQRYTICKVRYNDESDKYKPKIEYVESVEGIQKFGVIENSIAPMGLTSKTQAQRAGRYLLTSSLNETEIVDFSAKLEASYLRPGDIIKVLDNNRINQRLAGMLVGVDSSQGSVDLDFPVDCIIESSDSDSYLKFDTYSPSGNILDNDSVPDSSKTSLFHPTQISELYITGLSADKNTAFLAEYTGNDGYSSSTDSFENTLSRMKVGYAWAASNTGIGVEADFGLYRIITVSEQDNNEYQINAIQHAPSKFDFIDRINEKALVTKSLGPYIDIEKPDTPTRKDLSSTEDPEENSPFVTYDPVTENRGRGQRDYFRIMRNSNTNEEGVTTYQWYAMFNWISNASNKTYYKLYFSDQLVEDGYIRTTDGSSFQFNLKTYSEKHSTVLDVEGVEEDDYKFFEVNISTKINLLIYGYSGNPEDDNVVLSNDYINLEYNPDLDLYNLSQDIATPISLIQSNLPAGGHEIVDTDYLGTIRLDQVIIPWVKSPQLYFIYTSETNDSWVYVEPSSFPNSSLSGWTFIPSNLEIEDLNGTGVMKGWIYRYGYTGPTATPFNESERWVYLSTENNSGKLQVRDDSAGFPGVYEPPVYYDLLNL